MLVLRLGLVSVLLVATSACGRGFEHALAATLNHKSDVGGRGALGMPRGPNGWVTQLVLAGESSGFLAAAGGVAWRKRAGLTPRFELALGVATRSVSVGGECVVSEAGEQTCTDGLGPYGEATIGLDIPLGDQAPALTVGALGASYLNSDQLEGRLILAVGVVWK